MSSIMNTHHTSEQAGDDVLGEWRNFTAKEIQTRIDQYRKSRGGERAKLDFSYEVGCAHYFKTHDYDVGKTDTAGHKFCCEMLDYCQWYNQAWFHWTCGAVGSLILICLIAICCCCMCSSGRGRYGKDLEENEEESESQISVMEEEEK